MLSALPTILFFTSGALSHGIISTPAPRAIGPALTTACGVAVNNAIKADNTSYVEQLTKIVAGNTKFDAASCNLYLCKGLQYSDNTENVQTWKAGDVVPIKIWLRIPHEGIANVSIVDTRQNKQVGEPLKLWTKGYAPGRSESDVPLDQKQFSITVPSGLESTCAQAGACVLQWWWLGTAAKQTYESCVDFKIAQTAEHYQERTFKA